MHSSYHADALTCLGRFRICFLLQKWAHSIRKYLKS